MSRSLVICPHYPIPENVGSHIRTMNFVRYFRQRGSVDLAYSHATNGTGAPDGMFDRHYNLATIEDHGPRQKLARWLELVSRPAPLERYDPAAETSLLNRIETGYYDRVLLRYVIQASPLLKLSSEARQRVIVDFDDILSGSLYDTMIEAADTGMRRFRLRANRPFLRSFEERCLGFRSAVFCSELDKQKLGARRPSLAHRLFVVPNVIDDTSFRYNSPGDGFTNGDVLLFVGGLMYRPNIEGLKWFISKFFGFFRQKYPRGRLLVVGHSPASDLAALCNATDGVDLIGSVTDVKEYYRQCRAVIVPMLAGGGTRIKILEAALARRPVLSTPVGADGLSLQDGTDLLLFQDPTVFMQKYGSLAERNTYDSLVQNSERSVKSKYCMSAFTNQLDLACA